VQIEDYHGDKNPYVHSAKDNIAHINANYLLVQMRTTVAFAGQLAGPVLPEYQLLLPFVYLQSR
jgi:hypothetical protein